MKEQDIFLYISQVPKARSHEYLERAVTHYITLKTLALSENAAETSIKIPDVSEWALQKGPHGKPYYPQAPDLHFSISHSGSFWVCGVCGAPIGVDLQVKKKKRKKNHAAGSNYYTERIARRYFHPQEQQFLLRGGDFFEIWSAKESYVKYTGNGIGADFASFSVSDGTALLDRIKTSHGDGPALRHLPFHASLQPDAQPAPETEEAYSLCLCAHKIGEICFLYL